jgi:hypothetical protein
VGKSGNVVRGECISGQARRHVENRLRAHAWDRCTADVFQSHCQGAAVVADAVLFSSEERRPPSVVLDEANDA